MNETDLWWAWRLSPFEDALEALASDYRRRCYLAGAFFRWWAGAPAHRDPKRRHL